jgi:hypothetical protein
LSGTAAQTYTFPALGGTVALGTGAADTLTKWTGVNTLSNIANAAGYLYNNGAGAFSYVAAPVPAAHDILSASHGDTLAAGVARGDLIVGNLTPKWAALAKGTSGAIVTCNATDTLWSTYFLAGTAGQTYTFGSTGGTLPTAAGTLTVATLNAISAAGVITHAITSSSNPGAAASILASNASGYLQLVRIGAGVAPSVPIDGYLAGAGAVCILTASGVAGWIQFNEVATPRGYFGYGDDGNIFAGAFADSMALRAQGYLHLGGGGNQLALSILNRNLMLNGTGYPATMVGGMVFYTGTLATANAVDGFAVQSADRAAGQAGALFRNESGVLGFIGDYSGFGIALASLHSTLHSGGSFSAAYVATAIGITLDATHNQVKVTAACTITLPTAIGIAGREYSIHATADNVIIACALAQTINGSATQTLLAQEALTMFSDGANWFSK